MENETSKFWPIASEHRISSLTLDFEGNIASNDLAKNVTNTLKISDAIHALEKIESENVEELSKSLSLEIANYLLKIESGLTDFDSIEAIKFRVEILRGGDKKHYSSKICCLNEKELIVFCGNLTTWLGKSRKTQFSSFFSTPNTHYQNIADQADTLVRDAFEEVRLDLALPIWLGTSCRFKVTNLLASAGEANSYPKHFAYFLPEDEGIKFSSEKRTIVFINTYLALFEKIARCESIHHFNFDYTPPHIHDSGKYLISWFRAHDISHSIYQNETNFSALSRIDRWGSMIVQEVIADVFGFLFCMTESWQNTLYLEKQTVVHIYALEMLRYLRRGPLDFPDAGAAFVQLRYLIENGFIKINPINQKISISVDSFFSGMRMLATTLSKLVLSGNLSSSAQFMSRYCPHLNANACRELQFLGKSTCTLDYFQSVYKKNSST